MSWPDDKVLLYTTHRAALIEYALPIVGDRTRAEDVVQEAFMRFAPQEGSADADVKRPLGYLYRIVRNLAYDLTRRRAVEDRALKDDRSWWKVPTDAGTPEQDLSHRQQLDALEAALAALPESVRRAVTMHRSGDFTLQQIADALDVSLNTAHRWVRQGIARVAMHLAQPDD